MKGKFSKKFLVFEVAVSAAFSEFCQYMLVEVVKLCGCVSGEIGEFHQYISVRVSEFAVEKVW